MTSEAMTAPKNRVFISGPNECIKGLSGAMNLIHGLLITELSPMVNEGYVETYFKNRGFHVRCKILKFRNAGVCTLVAYVWLATEDEADEADWAGPHKMGGNEVVIRRVARLKQIEDESKDEIERGSSKRPVDLCYALEDPQWLEKEDKGKEDAV